MSDPGTVERWTLYVAEDNGSLPAVWPGVDSRPWRGHRRVVVVPEANLTACALDLAAALDTEPLIREVLELYLAETRWAETAEAPPVLANVPRIRERRAAIERRLAGQPEGED